MIELQVPRDAVRVFKIFWCRIKKQARTVNWRDAVRGEVCYTQALILFEGADVEWDLVVEESDAAANDSAIGIRWCNDEAETRREVVVLPDTVAIVTKSEIEHDTRVHDPLVLHKRG